MTNSTGKAKLSKNLLQMKFMKRTALKAEEEEKTEQEKVVKDAEHWTVPDLGHRESRVFVDPGYTIFEDLKYGRMSFRGFNPNIEKIMKAQNDEQEDIESERREQANAVSDDEMAERYNSLVHTMKKKFDKNHGRKSRLDSQWEKRKRSGKNRDEGKEEDEEEEEGQGPTPPKKKREFLKPKD